jgi:Flp pilus assembly protein TadD
LTALKEAAKYQPNDVGVLTDLGIAFRQNNNYEEALPPLRKVVALQGNEPESHYLLGNTAMMARRFDEAIASFNRVLELKPDHTIARERLQVATARKELAPKLEAWKQGVIEKPNDAQAHAQLGHGFNASGMFAEAEAEFQTAIRLDPENADYDNLQAINYSEWGKNEKAIESFKRAISLKPHHVLYFSLGNTYQKLGRLDEAAQAYQRSIEIKPSFTYGLYQLGLIYSGQGRHSDAINLFRKVLDVEPRDVYANHALGVSYAVIGNKTGAMQQYYILKDLNPDLAASLLSLIPK